MGLFRRVNDIISANLNELIDGFEEPEKMLRQAVREMETALQSALDGAARVIANEKLLARRVEEHRQRAGRWQRRAEETVRRGEDDAARGALTRRIEHEKLAAALDDQLSAARTTSLKLRRQIEAMRVRLAEARRKQVTLAARQRAADARRKFLSDLEGLSVQDEPFGRFDRFCEKVEQSEAEADALAELLGSGPDEEPFDHDVEAELEALKRDVTESRDQG